MNFIGIDKKCVLVWRIRLSIVTAALLLLNTLLFYDETIALIVIAAIILVPFLVMFFWYYPLKYRKLSYASAEDLLVINCGVIYTRRKSILSNNIQYITLTTTPLTKLFGLCTLFFHAAGSFVYLPCLSHDAARNLQHLLTSDSGEDCR
ncbi:MAG: PH domain-containing protein [Hydrogenoanaerobacterium sp.]